MKLSIDIPDEWAIVLRKAALNAGYKSVSEYIRNLISTTLEIEHTVKSWGGARQPLPREYDDAPASDAVPTLTYDQVAKGVHRKNEATMYPIDDHERQFGKINLGDEQRYVDIED